MDGRQKVMATAARAGILLMACVTGVALAAPPEKGSTNDIPGELPGIRMVSPAAAGQWTMPAGDYGNTRFSPLNLINTQNVKNLHVVTTMSTGIPHGHEGQPLVVNDTMYVVTPFPNNLIALDLTKPGFPQKWIFHPNPAIAAVGVACCDVVNRGASYADGKIIYNTLDDHTVAVDANTGKLVWDTAVGDISSSAKRQPWPRWW
jgi:glucose dehydrogenase